MKPSDIVRLWLLNQQDFGHWSGFTITQAKAAAANLPRDFIKHFIEGLQYIMLPGPDRDTHPHLPGARI